MHSEYSIRLIEQGQGRLKCNPSSKWVFACNAKKHPLQ